jgi:hypothetical protein
VLQCGGLASREFVCDVTACWQGYLVVWVGRGVWVCGVETGGVGLDGMWGSFCVCWVSFGEYGGA